MKALLLVFVCLLAACDEGAESKTIAAHHTHPLTIKSYDDSQMRSIEADDVKEPIKQKQKIEKHKKHHKHDSKKKRVEDDYDFPGSPVPGTLTAGAM
ncbi:UNVERIFIED_CONTAM: hypothetical protein RF648_19515 [Kocuria sp. CPCC 205274]